MNRCIDAGREGCPCILAESGDCLVCSRLGGGTCDDCSWQGTCIYTIYQQSGQHRAPSRQEKALPIVEVRAYNAGFKVFILQADRGFCQKAAAAGAYVFVRADGSDSKFDTPISILKSEPDKGLIHLGVCACGPKSKALLSQDSCLIVRGVYYNGLSGLQTLETTPEKTLIFAKGIAIAPLRNFLDGGQRYVRYLKNLSVFVDLDKIGFDFFRDYFGDLPADAIEICDFLRFDFRQIPMHPRDNIFALTSPYYVEQIQQAAGESTKILRPASGNFCCGEGVCGACTCSDDQGLTIRRCKAK